MFVKKNKRKVIENYGSYRVIKSSLNNKYYVQKKILSNIIFSKWITICIPHQYVEEAQIVALYGERNLIMKNL